MRSTVVFALLMILMLVFGSACAGPGAKEIPPDPLGGDLLYADVIKYISFGEHRTAYPGDINTAEYIVKSLKQAGLDVEQKTWTLNQFFLTDCKLNVDGREFECFPAWYPNTTPVTGKLALYNHADTSNLKGHIAYADSSFGIAANISLNDIAETVRDAGATGLVIVCRNQSNSGLLTAVNAKRKGQSMEYHQAPLPIPSVIVADNDNAKLSAAASAGLTASISINGQHKTDVKAHNVLATLKRSDKWIIVTTPLSGWFTCGGERGPGVALFLGLARWAAQQHSKHSFAFIANSGHELDNMGAHFTLDEYLSSYDISQGNVTAWLHLGAGIACRKWEKDGSDFRPLEISNPSAFLQATEALLPPIKPAFQDIQGLKIGTGSYGGELGEIVDAGYNAFGFFGNNFFFHTRMDTEKETSPQLLEPIARASAIVLTELDSK